jgi:hypothetical protein
MLHLKIKALQFRIRKKGYFSKTQSLKGSYGHLSACYPIYILQDEPSTLEYAPARHLEHDEPASCVKMESTITEVWPSTC